jgi:hypothetical protein
MATPRAAKPVPSAISVPIGVPPPSADTLATGLAPTVPELGATEGNRPAALPPGLIVGVGNAKPDAVMLGSDGDTLAPVGLPGARTPMEVDAAGAVARLAALPVTVRLTAVMVAVSGTLTSAWNNRCAELASTAPRSHADVPLPLAQPKVKVGIPAPAVDCSWILASGTLPPSVQAPTSNLAACPRSLLCCRGTTPTHRLTGVVLAAWNAVKTMAWPEPLPAAALVVDVSVGVGVGVEVVGSGVGVDVVGSGVGVDVVGSGVGVDVVGSGVGVVGADVVGADVVGADVVGAELAGADVVGVGVVGVADGVVVAVADALGDALANCSGSQDSLSPGMVAAVAPLDMAATTPPEAAVIRALPAIKVAARRRPCAIRIPTNTGPISL